MSMPLRLRVSSDRELLVLEGNIIHQDTDAIVNAANSTLMGGGGVDGAIHRAGGPAILEDCKRVIAQIGSLPAGQAVATAGGHLRARHVVHTVGPIWSGGYYGEPELLESCYRESMSRADELHLRSVAFPSISTGAFGYPLPDAAAVAVPAVIQALQSSTYVHHVRFVLFGGEAFAAYREALEKWVEGAGVEQYQIEQVSNPVTQ
jgi:O-acetyl-ADP-ribose deacetylase (regulator of RNase III)